jgi:RimJ/RimL family protein N-acetyltransferase
LIPPLLAAVESMTSVVSGPARIDLDPSGFEAAAAGLAARGLAQRERDGKLSMRAGMVWQRPEPWLARTLQRDFPLQYAFSKGRRHPLRAPKPEGVFYTRFIPWLARTLIFRAATMDDLDRLHGWMNDPRIDLMWKSAATRDQHQTYLANLIADPHNLGLIGEFDGQPFGWFEVYWAKENRLGPFYEAGDYDRGWHVLVGDERFRGKAYISAWLPSLMHAIFLDDPRTERIVGEPPADHHQQLRNLERSGFARIKTVEFPTKRATLVMLWREHFFEDRLWLPNEAG